MTREMLFRKAVSLLCRSAILSPTETAETTGAATVIPPQLKASGGIRDLAAAKEMIAAGAERLGTSATIAIMKEYFEEGIN